MERDPQLRASDRVVLRSPYGIRTRAATLRGWCPRPLDERAKLRRPTLSVGLCRPAGRLVGVRGIEPRITEPESAVLPVTPHPIGASDECTARVNTRHGRSQSVRLLSRSNPM